MKYYLLFFISFVFCQIQAQVGIGTITPDDSSMLDISSSNKGLLIPRIELSHTNNTSPVSSPAVGLLVYNTNTAGDVVPGFYYWTGSLWKSLISANEGGNSDSWNLQGNNITADDFLGPLQDWIPLRFKIGGNNFGQFHAAGGLSIGLNSSASDYSHGIAIGTRASASGINSTAIGYEAVVNQANTIRLGNDSAKVGIGTSTPGLSTIFEVNSSNQGILIPRVALASTTARDVITNPVESLLVYNTYTNADVTPGFYYWTGSAWKALGNSNDNQGSKTYGECYLDTDTTILLSQYDIVRNMPVGVVNPLSTADLTSQNNGFTIAGGAGGTYKVMLTVTYSKGAATSTANEVDFFLTSWGNPLPHTSVTVDLNDDLRKRTVTIVKLMSYDAYANYGWGIGKSDSGSPSITLHKDLTSFIIERMD